MWYRFVRACSATDTGYNIWTKMHYLKEVEDIITSPPERDQYTTLKTELVRRLSVSRDQRVRHLIHEEMGDRKPSQFLRHLKSLAPDDFLRSIWSNRLPPHIPAILAGQSEVGLDTASQLADRICEVTPPTNHCVSCPVSWQHRRVAPAHWGSVTPGGIPQR
jgi:hypothetical protein